MRGREGEGQVGGRHEMKGRERRGSRGKGSSGFYLYPRSVKVKKK